ncbi:MAG: glucose-6-phosphate isomerase [Phycisphaeraceae bacterium]|nr:glucose-6-phosphate isomerase [Phycisphaeraceae bacterium]
MDSLELWRRYRKYLCECSSVGMKLDISRVDFPSTFFNDHEEKMQAAYKDMRGLEAGDIANPDEQRMVGHYWLRTPHLAPNDEIAHEIEATVLRIKAFATQVHDREITPPESSRFTDMLLIGIGGSALGPQLIADALGTKRDKMAVHFLDNTDPDGFDRVIAELGARLKSTLVIVISKSGGTKETRNGMLEVQHAFKTKDLAFNKHAIAITSDGSRLDETAKTQQWIDIFPMWDWVGGRTSILSAVGLLPAALQGIDIDLLLQGAAEMDKTTRVEDTKKNPAARLALMWLHATGGVGAKDMVILPYKDRLLLMSRYLQQLVMESLGKEFDLDGNQVNQGIAVYGNKGSTDQHAYVQQLREGVNNFFATFIVVLQDRAPNIAKVVPDVEEGITSGDYLNGFWQGTRTALSEKGRDSITITFKKLDAAAVGSLIALYERAVGLYASLVNINAYHQPGVEAGKKAATTVLELQGKVVDWLKETKEILTIEQIADKMGLPHEVETLFHILEHMAVNKRGIVKSRGRFRYKV